MAEDKPQLSEMKPVGRPRANTMPVTAHEVTTARQKASELSPMMESASQPRDATLSPMRPDGSSFQHVPELGDESAPASKALSSMKTNEANPHSNPPAEDRGKLGKMTTSIDHPGEAHALSHTTGATPPGSKPKWEFSLGKPEFGGLLADWARANHHGATAESHAADAAPSGSMPKWEFSLGKPKVGGLLADLARANHHGAAAESHAADAKPSGSNIKLTVNANSKLGKGLTKLADFAAKHVSAEMTGGSSSSGGKK